VGGAASLLGAGTFLYMSPEVRQGKAAAAPADMFGWGLCTLLAFVPEAEAEAAKALGPHPDAARLEAEVGKALARLSAADAPLGALVKACLDPDPSRRPTAAAVLRHEVFSLAARARGVYPPYWERVSAEASPDGFALHAVKPGDAEWAPLEALLQTDGGQLNVGRDYREPGAHTRLVLASARRIESPGLWQSYRAAQRRVDAEVSRARQAGVQVPDLAVRPGLAEATRALPGVGGLRAGLNEAYLLHGTAPKNVLALLAGGLNERYSEVAAYGNGNYLAEDAGKCDQYVTNDPAFGAEPELHKRLYPGGAAEHPGKVYYVLVCRTTLGAYLRTRTWVSAAGGCVSLDTGARVFPANNRELSLIPGVSPPAHHHGLVVEKGGPSGIRFREFLVFHGEYAYPEYLLAYRRE